MANNTKIGTANTNLVLETAGRVLIKVGERFYDLNFKNNDDQKQRFEVKDSVDMSDYVTIDLLKEMNLSDADSVMLIKDRISNIDSLLEELRQRIDEFRVENIWTREGDIVYPTDNEGVTTNSFVSVKGVDSDAFSAGGGIDEDELWQILGTDSEQKKIPKDNIEQFLIEDIAGLSSTLQELVASKNWVNTYGSESSAEKTAYGQPYWQNGHPVNIETNQNLDAGRIHASNGIYSNTFVSAKGKNPDAFSSDAGLDVDQMFDALSEYDDDPNHKIAEGYLPISGLDNRYVKPHNGKIPVNYIPDYILGQVLYGGSVDRNGVTTLSQSFMNKNNIVSLIISDTNASNYEGVYFIATENAPSIAGVSDIVTGDWIISTGSEWVKIDNTDSVSSVAGLTGVIQSAALSAALGLGGDHYAYGQKFWEGSVPKDIPVTANLQAGEIHATDKIISDGSISAMGSDSDASQQSGSFDSDIMWELLSTESSELINPSHIDLSDYATTQWVVNQGYLKQIDLDDYIFNSGNIFDNILINLGGSIVSKGTVNGIEEIHFLINDDWTYFGAKDIDLYSNNLTINGDTSLNIVGPEEAPINVDGSLSVHGDVTSSGAISSSNVNSSASTVGGFFDENALWEILGSSGINQIDASHIAAALMDYATNAKVDSAYITILGNNINLGGSVSVEDVISSLESAGKILTDTTYSLTQDSSDGHKITFTSSSGGSVVITIPDNNTTYSAGSGLSKTSDNEFNLNYASSNDIGGIKIGSGLKNENNKTVVEHAPKLQNARYIWGQQFDGTANVSGALSNVTNITATGDITTSGAISSQSSNSSSGTIGSSFDEDAMWTVLNRDSSEQINLSHLNLSDYSTKAWVEGKNYLTQHQSLSGYATETWVNQQGYLTQHQSLTNYSTKANTIKSLSISGKTITYTKGDDTTGTLTTQDTTYSAGAGIGLSGTTFYNSGVRSISIGDNNGTIKVNTDGASTNVSVRGLGNRAFDSTEYLPLSGGIISNNNTWFTNNNKYQLQLGRADTSIPNNKAIIGVTDGNLHLDSYSGYGLYLNFYANGNNSGSAGLMIQPSGNVSIGTTNNSYKLDVNGIIRATSGIISGSTITASGSITSSGAISASSSSSSAGQVTTGGFDESAMWIALGGSTSNKKISSQYYDTYTLPAAGTSLGGIKVGYSTNGKNYKVQLDSNNNAYVNVPWTDTNTTYSFSNKNATLAWGATSTIATVGGTNITVTMPANPDTNTWRPIGTGASDAAAGNHTHSYLPLSGGVMSGSITLPTGCSIYGVNETSGAMLHWDGSRAVLGSWGNSTTAATHIRSKTGHATIGIGNDATYNILDSGNYSNYAIPLSGGTINHNAQIQKNGWSEAWYTGRNSALIRINSAGGYNTLASIKTTDGSWDIGHYTESSYGNKLLFSYCTDANINNNNNTYESQIRFNNNGTISAAGFSGNASSATQLANSRTLWGRSFNGTGNVSGNLTGVGYGIWSSEYSYLGFYTSGSGALSIYTKQILCSNSYSDSSNIPANGIYATGDIKTAGNVRVSKTIIVNPDSSCGDYNEGLRLNRGTNNWAALMIGAKANTDSGSQEGWGLFRNASGDFQLAYNTSSTDAGLRITTGDSFLWKGNTILHSGNISSYAITSHQSISHLLPLSGGTMTGRINFDNIAPQYGYEGARIDVDASTVFSSFRTKMFGGYNSTIQYCSFLTPFRNVTGNDYSPLVTQYGSGIAWAASDTHAYLSIGYSSSAKNAYIGGGAANSINWIAELIHSQNIGNQSVNYANYSGYTNLLGSTGNNGIDANNPTVPIIYDYGSGASRLNMPSGWLYGSVFTMSSYGAINGSLSGQLCWDVQHDTTYSGKLWFRGKDSARGWKSWTEVITGQNLTNTTLSPSFSTIAVVNDSCNTSYDALAYFRHRSNHDWTVIIDSAGYTYGLDIRCLSSSEYALQVEGAARFKNKIIVGNTVTLSWDGTYLHIDKPVKIHGDVIVNAT